MWWRRTSVSLLLVAPALVSCNRSTEGPLAYQGHPSNWIGPVAVGQQRAWGLISFGKKGIRATVTSVTFGTPPPDGLVTRIELNKGQLVPVGAIDRSAGETVQRLPGDISGVVQIVVWFEPREPGIEYFTRSTMIRYSIDGREYVAKYPVGVGICSVERVTATTACDVGSRPDS
jgi:hypothetical protein